MEKDSFRSRDKSRVRLISAIIMAEVKGIDAALTNRPLSESGSKSSRQVIGLLCEMRKKPE